MQHDVSALAVSVQKIAGRRLGGACGQEAALVGQPGPVKGEAQKIPAAGLKEVAGFPLLHELFVIAGRVPAPGRVKALCGPDLHKGQSHDRFLVEPQAFWMARADVVQPGVAEILAEHEPALRIPGENLRRGRTPGVQMAANAGHASGFGQLLRPGLFRRQNGQQRAPAALQAEEAAGRAVGLQDALRMLQKALDIPAIHGWMPPCVWLSRRGSPVRMRCR